MNHDSLGFVEAVEDLAGGLHLAVQYESEGPTPTANYTPLYELMAAAQACYARLLREHPTKERAVEYLKRRGLTGAVA